MRLDDARLCLDCEEIHRDQECPACGSEAFGFLTRWIQSTSPDRPKMRQSASAAPAKEAVTSERSTPSPEYLAAMRQIVDGTTETGRAKKAVTRGLLGLAAAGLAGWAWSRGALDPDEDDGA